MTKSLTPRPGTALSVYYKRNDPMSPAEDYKRKASLFDMIPGLGVSAATSKLLDIVKSQASTAVSLAAAAFLEAGQNASTILKETNLPAAAKLVGSHPTMASITALLTAAGVSYVVVRKLKSLVSRKGGVSKITRTNTKKLKKTEKMLSKTLLHSRRRRSKKGKNRRRRKNL